MRERNVGNETKSGVLVLVESKLLGGLSMVMAKVVKIINK